MYIIYNMYIVHNICYIYYKLNKAIYRTFYTMYIVYNICII